MDEIPHFELTRYGFEYGAGQVTRLASNEGTVMIGVSKRTLPDYGPFELTIYISPKGNRIRVFRGGKELL